MILIPQLYFYLPTFLILFPSQNLILSDLLSLLFANY